MNYSHANHANDNQRDGDLALDELEAERKKNYTRGRVNRSQKKRSRRKSEQPSCGIGGRRNKRFSW